MEQKCHDERLAGETLLLGTLQLRGMLERALSLVEPVQGEEEMEGVELQQKYVRVHSELAALREDNYRLSTNKVGLASPTSFLLMGYCLFGGWWIITRVYQKHSFPNSIGCSVFMI